MHFDVGRYLPSALGFGPGTAKPFKPPEATPPPPAQRAALSDASAAPPQGDDTDLAGKLDSASRGGTPLAPNVRTQLEDQLGASLSAVRIHTGSQAAELARSVAAASIPTGPAARLKYQVPFRPGEPPPLVEEPADLPNGDVLLYPILPHAAGIRRGIAGHRPARRGKSGVVRNCPLWLERADEEFVKDADAATARGRLTGPLRQVLTDIQATRDHLAPTSTRSTLSHCCNSAAQLAQPDVWRSATRRAPGPLRRTSTACPAAC
jgi:hypothetical protein